MGFKKFRNHGYNFRLAEALEALADPHYQGLSFTCINRYRSYPIPADNFILKFEYQGQKDIMNCNPKDADKLIQEILLALKDNRHITCLCLNSLYSFLDGNRSGERTLLMIKALASVIEYNTTLETIVLESNYVFMAGAKLLALSLKKNHSLKHIDMAFCSINYEGILAIVEAVAQHPRLQSLYLDRNFIWSKNISAATGIKEIANSIRACKSLLTLHLPTYLPASIAFAENNERKAILYAELMDAQIYLLEQCPQLEEISLIFWCKDRDDDHEEHEPAPYRDSNAKMTAFLINHPNLISFKLNHTDKKFQKLLYDFCFKRNQEMKKAPTIVKRIEIWNQYVEPINQLLSELNLPPTCVKQSVPFPSLVDLCLFAARKQITHPDVAHRLPDAIDIVKYWQPKAKRPCETRNASSLSIEDGHRDKRPK